MTPKQQIEELNNTKLACGLVIAYLLIGMFITGWNLLYGLLFICIPVIALEKCSNLIVKISEKYAQR